MRSTTTSAFLLALATAGTASCSDSDPSQTPSPTMTSEVAVEPLEGAQPDYGPGVPFGPDESIFERSHVVEVEVNLPQEDWDTLRHEGMSFGEINRPSGENGVRVVPEYTPFAAEVTVDGVVHENVSIKKKGYIGSLSNFRPSLKFNFSKNFEQPLAAGMKRMTLNNDRQDPSHTRQCMAYDLFARLGLPAPRCNFAHVVVNGTDLGTYTHLEGIKKPMLSRYFEDTDGNLYEGELSDFSPDTVDRLELKTNKTEGDRSDLQPVLDALTLPDDQVLEALGQVVDLDHFFDFWALETLIGHWDGYSGNSNNYRVYRDPTSERFFFIPWGMDQSFVGRSSIASIPFQSTVYARGTLANRLYALPEQRERFRTRLAELVEELWDVPELLAQVDEISNLVGDAVPTNLEVQRSYLRSRGEQLLLDLQEPAQDWVEPESVPVEEDECAGTTLELSGDFSTVWTSDPSPVLSAVSLLRPESTATVNLGAEPLAAGFQAYVGGGVSDADVELHHRATFTIESLDADNRLWILQMGFRRESISPGFHAFHGIESTGQVAMYDFETQLYHSIAAVGGGGIQLDEASLLEGGSVAGSFQATAYLSQCLSTALSASEQIRAQQAQAPSAEAEDASTESNPATEALPASEADTSGAEQDDASDSEGNSTSEDAGSEEAEAEPAETDEEE